MSRYANVIYEMTKNAAFETYFQQAGKTVPEINNRDYVRVHSDYTCKLVIPRKVYCFGLVMCLHHSWRLNSPLYRKIKHALNERREKDDKEGQVTLTCKSKTMDRTPSCWLGAIARRPLRLQCVLQDFILLVFI